MDQISVLCFQTIMGHIQGARGDTGLYFILNHLTQPVRCDELTQPAVTSEHTEQVATPMSTPNRWSHSEQVVTPVSTPNRWPCIKGTQDMFVPLMQWLPRGHMLRVKKKKEATFCMAVLLEHSSL